MQATQYPELDSIIEKLGILKETFEKKVLTEHQINECNTVSKSLIALKLCFKAQVLNRLYDYFDHSFISLNDDGSFNLDVILPEREWLYSYILSFGSSVEVIEPEHVRKRVSYEIKQAFKLYEL